MDETINIILTNEGLRTINLCYKLLFPRFYSFQQHKTQKHGFLTKVGTKSIQRLKEVLKSEVLDKNNEQLQQELSACQHFFDDTEMEKERHRLFNCMLSKLDPKEINR